MFAVSGENRKEILAKRIFSDHCSTSLFNVVYKNTSRYISEMKTKITFKTPDHHFSVRDCPPGKRASPRYVYTQEVVIPIGYQIFDRYGQTAATSLTLYCSYCHFILKIKTRCIYSFLYGLGEMLEAVFYKRYQQLSKYYIDKIHRFVPSLC